MTKSDRSDSGVLHLVVGESASGSLKQALRLARRKDQVVVFPDNLSFGPIDPGDNTSRSAWIRETLGLPRSHTAGVAARIDAFWETVLSARGQRLLWVTRRSACDYAGFLEWLWRLRDKPFEVVEVTDIEVTRARGEREQVHSLGEMPPACIVENALWDRAAPLTRAKRERYHALWQKLRAENAPFRVMAGDLVSAPITVYDELLMSCTRNDWRKVALVVAQAMHSSGDVSDLVLQARVRAVAAAGRLESQGDLRKMRFSEVRLPQSGC